MDDARIGDTFKDLSRKLVSGEGGPNNLVLFGYIIIATVIGGAGSTGAGLFILAIGLLMMLTLHHAPWKSYEAPEAGATRADAGEAQEAAGTPDAPAGMRKAPTGGSKASARSEPKDGGKTVDTDASPREA